ncbi:hypothetical protein DsansV1_C48g0243621 [Dioscorea sansibarensis]
MLAPPSMSSMTCRTWRLLIARSGPSPRRRLLAARWIPRRLSHWRSLCRPSCRGPRPWRSRVRVSLILDIKC